MKTATREPNTIEDVLADLEFYKQQGKAFWAAKKEESKPVKEYKHSEEERRERREIDARYLSTHPWARKWKHAQTRCLYDKKTWQYKRGLAFTATLEDFHKAWVKSKADQMENPSIDRIQSHFGYIPGNLRFIELEKNLAQKRSPYWKQTPRYMLWDF